MITILVTFIASMLGLAAGWSGAAVFALSVGTFAACEVVFLVMSVWADRQLRYVS